MYIIENEVVKELAVSSIIEGMQNNSVEIKPVVSKIKLVKISDDCADYSYLVSSYDYDEEENELVIYNSCQYSNSDIEEYGVEKVLAWLKQDEKHLENLGSTWEYVGVKAEVTVNIPHKDIDGNIVMFEQTLESSGLWGIEDNWSAESDQYILEVFSDQLYELKMDCSKMNIETAMIEEYFNEKINGIA